MAKKTASKKSISSTKHSDTRSNIPTEELRDFVSEDEKEPSAIRYPRDPSLDPQLVWQGKDRLDGEDLFVQAIPIYIQEKIHPRAIIEDIRSQSSMDSSDQLDLFSDFNGLPFEDLIDFYQHQQNWSNRLILGDSMQVMTSLAEKEGLKAQVQMIYIDPPYGIKFGSNWQVSTRKRQVKDGKAADVVRQPEQVKAFRDTWELGIHSYLSYLRDRLVTARELLSNSGSVFVQIGDENVHLVRSLMDEVFGSENFISQIVFAKTSGLQSLYLYGISDYILWYGKNKDETKFRQLNIKKVVGDPGATKYTRIELPNGERRTLTSEEKEHTAALPEGARYWVDGDLTSQGNPLLEFKHHGRVFQGTYKTNLKGMARLAAANRIYVAGKTLRFLRYLNDFLAVPMNSAWMDIGGIQSRTDPKIYVVQTATEAIKRCMLMTTDPGDLVLDPTCGSGTTAYVAEQWGRRWITIDTSRVSLTLARTRLMAARFPYYVLSDSPEGAKLEAEATGHVDEDYYSHSPYQNDIRDGFVYRRVPHIRLRDFAKNEEIDDIQAKYQADIEPLLEGLLNSAQVKNLQEWELPLDARDEWPQEVKIQLNMYWKLRLQRQSEIDASVARHSESELLYDDPFEDSRKLRVAGPFTVESLSPHRILGVDEPRPTSEIAGETASADFSVVILENLRKAGVQNTIKNERLKLDRLESYAGEWLQAEGEYTEKDNSIKRVAVAIGPEHGTVGPLLVKEAAKEAVRGVGFDLLLVCGFAFDPHVDEETQRYGKLTVLPVRMNPDLTMGDTLLKKTGSGNLFMVFGEPDVNIKKTEDGQVEVEVRGVDIYDPTTGQIRSSSTDDIACWFIDTEYNEESFFVRHAYFTGADKPYENLKRSLRAEISEEAWEGLYRTTSRPFDEPDSGRIAIKVINHYGDEVLKVYEI